MITGTVLSALQKLYSCFMSILPVFVFYCMTVCCIYFLFLVVCVGVSVARAIAVTSQTAEDSASTVASRLVSPIFDLT